MRKWLILSGALVLTALLGAMISSRLPARLGDYVRLQAVDTLRERFATDAEFSSFHVSVFPEIRIKGEGLVLRRRGRTDIPPLITVRKFSASAGILQLVARPSHIREVTLEGLTITLPPREHGVEAPRAASLGQRPSSRVFVANKIVSDNAELDMLSRDPGKPPRVFIIHHLTLHHAGPGQPMSYQATLENPRPVGEIETRGQFGPWQRDEPSLTPLTGTYTFTHADLASFRGLGGILSSKGKFTGILEHVEVEGETTTPDFRLGLSHHPCPLETQFHAVVDGTNGNTMLEPVRARLLNSDFVVRGGVFKVQGQKHRTVLLEAAGTEARLEDFLRLALKADAPAMTGSVSFKTKIDIPAGEGGFGRRLKLDGQFNISSARFTKFNVQRKLAALSRRGRGDSREEDPGGVVSNIAAKFALRSGTMTFRDLTFGVPGAFVRLNGTYTLKDEAVDFRGSLRLQARLSQTTKGWKSIFLKPVDPLFERGGAGTLLPIRITGTGSDPHFGLDIGRALRR